MKLNLYAIYDKKAEIYQTPAFLQSDIFAIRSIRSALQDATSMLTQYPDDFALVKIGEFDPQTGDVISVNSVILSTFAGLQEEKKAPEA